MTITDWFHKREERRPAPGVKRTVPDGIWSKCAHCNQTIYQGEVLNNHQVCPECGFHYRLPARDRVALLVDEGTFEELDAYLVSKDPLKFKARKGYLKSLRTASAETGLSDAVVTGLAAVGGHPVGLGVMEFQFIGGSMGSVVGEKVARLAERCVDERRPLITVAASGGARMQEGVLSLMQMAKTSAAIGRLADSGLPFVSIVTNPTTGGVTASFATLADVIIAEPEALVGFAGPRVIEQTINQKLPKGFQRSEFALEHGLVDMIVPRGELKATLTQLLNFLVSEKAVAGKRVAAAGKKGRR